MLSSPRSTNSENYYFLFVPLKLASDSFSKESHTQLQNIKLQIYKGQQKYTQTHNTHFLEYNSIGQSHFSNIKLPFAIIGYKSEKTFELSVKLISIKQDFKEEEQGQYLFDICKYIEQYKNFNNKIYSEFVNLNESLKLQYELYIERSSFLVQKLMRTKCKDNKISLQSDKAQVVVNTKMDQICRMKSPKKDTAEDMLNILKKIKGLDSKFQEISQRSKSRKSLRKDKKTETKKQKISFLKQENKTQKEQLQKENKQQIIDLQTNNKTQQEQTKTKQVDIEKQDQAIIERHSKEELQQEKLETENFIEQNTNGAVSKEKDEQVQSPQKQIQSVLNQQKKHETNHILNKAFINKMMILLFIVALISFFLIPEDLNLDDEANIKEEYPDLFEDDWENYEVTEVTEPQKTQQQENTKSKVVDDKRKGKEKQERKQKQIKKKVPKQKTQKRSKKVKQKQNKGQTV